MSDCREELEEILNDAYEHFDEDTLFDLSHDELVEYRELVENALEFTYEHEDDIPEDSNAHSIKKDLQDVLWQIDEIVSERNGNC